MKYFLIQNEPIYDVCSCQNASALLDVFWQVNSTLVQFSGTFKNSKITIILYLMLAAMPAEAFKGDIRQQNSIKPSQVQWAATILRIIISV